MLRVSVIKFDSPGRYSEKLGNLILARVKTSLGAILRSIKSEAEYWCCDSSLLQRFPFLRAFAF